MKILACSDMGLSCPFVAKGETTEDVVAQLAKHGNEMHPEEVKEMKSQHSEEELTEMMTSKVGEE